MSKNLRSVCFKACCLFFRDPTRFNRFGGYRYTLAFVDAAEQGLRKIQTVPCWVTGKCHRSLDVTEPSPELPESLGSRLQTPKKPDRTDMDWSSGIAPWSCLSEASTRFEIWSFGSGEVEQSFFFGEFTMIFKRYGVQSPTTRNDNHRLLKNTNQTVVFSDFI